jgi:hypothetical protein
MPMKEGGNLRGKGGPRKSAKGGEDAEAKASSSPRKTRSKTKDKIFEDMPRKTRSKMKVIDNDENGRVSRMTRSSAGTVGGTKRKFTVDVVTQSSKTATKKVGANVYPTTTTDYLLFIQRRVG